MPYKILALVALSLPAFAHAADAVFTETDFAVGNLPGTLTLPAGNGKFPAVVLVHGSGPHDRDETIGPNKPFLDIAHGLAAQGIAVLRYDKRTKVHPQEFGGRDFTMDDETTDDAVAAIAELAADPRIDRKRIFVFGHSQGAMLAPRIVKLSGKAAGAIMLATPARSLLDILQEQYRRQFQRDGEISAQEQGFLDKLQAQVAAVRSGGDVAAADSPLGVPAAYWRHADNIHQIDDAKALKQPLLLLQGGHDIQVVDTDWQLWQVAMKNDKRVTLKFYPALSHLGIVGEGTPADYATPGHVDAQLVANAGAWIKAH